MRGPSRGAFGLRSLVCLLSLALSLALSAPAAADPPAKAGELIIKFRPGTAQSVIDAIKADLGATRLRAFGRIHAEQDRIAVGTVQDAINRYKNHPAIEIIEPNYLVSEAVAPNDPFFPQLWGLNNTGQTGGTPGADISATDAWNTSTGDSAVVVAIIDTGVDYHHPDLAANIFVNTGEVPGNGLDDDGNGFIDDVRGWDFVNHDNDPFDDRGHGTHVAGTIGAVGNNSLGVAGIAWNVRILPVKFLNSAGSGTTADAISSIEYATMMGADIMNNSWGGGGYSLALQQAIQDANTAGILFVAAAGNAANNNDALPFYPASYDVPNVISVAATDALDHLASFSNFGATSVDLGAPGVDILSTLPGAGYGLNSGTSMAAPHVSGVLALMRAVFPSAPASALKARLLISVDPLPSLDGFVVSGGRENAARAIAELDSIPPSAPTSLEVVEGTSNTLRIRWIAGGDDGTTGAAASYEVRYSTAPITEASFPSATLAAGAPYPQPAGSTEEMEFGGLDNYSTYYVAVRATDEVGNASPISNVASGETLGAPSIEYSPASITAALLVGAGTNRTIQLGNNGEGTLDFTISDDFLNGSSTVQEYLPVARGEIDPRVGDPVATGAGGPDAFGYRWADSDQAGGPLFEWAEISSVGTQLPLSQLDENYGPIPIGFSFPFYGTSFTSLRACTHGWLSFTNATAAFSNQPLPNAGAPENLLAVFWDDLNFSGVRRAYYHNDGSRFIVEYQNVPKTGGGGPFTFEVILYPNGHIVYQYLSMGDPTNSATIGIQNATRTDGLNVVFNTSYARSGLAIEFTRVPRWFAVTPHSGRVYAGTNTALDVAIDATDLVGGDYHGQARIVSNDPGLSVVTIPIDLTVTGVADIDLSRSSFDFGSVFVGGSRTDSMVVSNRGTNPLHVTEIVPSSSDFEVTPSSLTIAPGARQKLYVTFRPGSATPLTGSLAVRSDDPDEPELSVSLQGVGLVAPDITVTPTSVSADLLTGQTATRSVTIANEGGSDLSFDASLTHIVVPLSVPPVTPPARSASEIQSGYASFLADPSGSPPDASVPGPQPGIVPLWEHLEAVLADSTVIFHDDMENGTNGWTHTATVGGVDLWGQTNSRHSSGSWSWRVSQHAGAGSDALRSPVIDLRLQHDATLTFRQWYQFDDCSGDPTFEPDGGLVEISTDGGATWNQITPVGGYPYVLDDICQNPLANRLAYSHSGGLGATFVPAVFNLTPFVGSEISLRFHAGWDCGNCATNEGWYIDDVTVYSTFLPFLTVTPTAGNVTPGSSTELSARFDAAGLSGGNYSADISIHSNDPDESTVTVPASLHVTGVADIAWSPASVEFGTVFLGTSATDTLLVFNAGTDLLHVTGLSSDHAAFAVPTAGFDLTPGAVRIVPVVFSPDAVAPFSASITITSDDPDEAVVSVPLHGAGLIAPDIGVDPTAVSANLLTGQTAERTVTISNTGGSDLAIDITAEHAGAALGFGFTPSTHAPATTSSVEGHDDTPVPSLVGTAGPTPAVLVIQETDAWGLNMAAFIHAYFGITPTVIGSNQIAATDFSGYALIVTVGDESNSYYAALTANVAKFQAYVAAGGVVQYQLATQGSNVTIPAGVQVLYGGAEDQNRVLLPGHPIVAGLPSTLHGNAANHCHLTSLPAGAQIITETFLTHQPTTVEYRVGSGMVIATGMTWEFLYLFNFDAGPMLYNATQYSLTRGRPTWLSLTPASGTIPAGGALDVHVGFDASGLLGGRYDALVRVASNDPDERTVDVSATMNVTGVPLIAVSPASLDFGSPFVGATTSRTLLIKNPGTDVLTVSGITSDDPSYVATPAAFSVAIGDSETVLVTFSPTTPGAKPATLSIAHNAINSPTLVPLTGTGLIPPDIAVNPASLSADVQTGETSQQTLTVLNTGGSDLNFTVSIQPDPGALSGGSPVPVPTGLRVPTPNATSPSTGSPAAQAIYQGTHLKFGITQYGEIMPYQFPIGTEHLAVGTYRAGYVLAYIRDGIDHVSYAAQDSRQNMTPVSYTEVENSPSQVIVEVVTQTSDGAVRVRRLFTFPRSRQFVRVETTLQAAAGISAGNVVFKEFADWDADNDYDDDSWDYDRSRNMTYAWDQHYVGLASSQTPSLMDINGWNDFDRRTTTVDFPSGPVEFFDGLAVLHFALGDLGPSETEHVTVAYGAANTFTDLQGVMAEGVNFVDWLSVAPESGTVPAGGSLDLAVTFDPKLHVTGDYSARIVHVSNDPDEPELAIPATMHVTGVPVFAVSPAAIDFGSVYVGVSVASSVTVKNRGTEELIVSGLSLDGDSYSVNVSPFTLAPGDSMPITITFAPLSAGSKPGTLSFAHNAAGSPATVVLQGMAVEPPIMTVSPTTIRKDLDTDEVGHETLTVGNGGGSDLQFTVTAILGATAAEVDSQPPPGKGAPDARRGDVATLGSGGPDVFGYRWIDSDQSGGPTFQWTDIRATGTSIPISGDDMTSNLIPIGFTFKYYGQFYSLLRVCTNGWLSFTSNDASYSNTPLPSIFAPENLLAAFWDDLYFDPSVSRAYYRYDGTRFIVQFDTVFLLSGAGPYTFEVILYPTGAILYQYLSMAPVVDRATVGIQNVNRDDGLTVAFNQAYLHNGLAVRISSAPSWLTLSPDAGTVPAGGTLPIDLTFNAAGLFPRDYNASLDVAGNDPVTPHENVAVTLHIRGIPDIDVAPTSFDFDTLYTGQSAERALLVTNLGTDRLDVSSIAAGLPDFTVSPATLSIQPLQNATVTIRYTAGTVGLRSTNLTLTSNDPDSPTILPLRAVALIPPVVSVTPALVEAAAMPGGSATRTIGVCNTGGSDLRFLFAVTGAHSEPVPLGSYLPLGKEAVDPRVAALGTGGPDAFGHFWIDSDDPGGPVFQWTDITAIGTKIPFAAFDDDRTLGPYPIGFRFPFYGGEFLQFRACTNGWISFTSMSTAFANQPLPNAGPAVPENLLAPFWDDLIHRSDLGSSVYYYTDGTQLTVQFNNMVTFGPLVHPMPTFQIILRPTGEVIYQYLAVGDRSTGVTVGMQDNARDDGLNISFNALYPHDHLAIRIAEPAPWAHADPPSGVVPAGGCMPVTLTFDAGNLEEGDYRSTLRTLSNDPAHANVANDLLFHVHVVEAAAANFDPNTLNLDSNGRFTSAYVELPAGLDPNQVVLSTVRFRDALGVAQDALMLGDFNHNGVPDLQFRFDREQMEGILPEGPSVPIWMTGEVENTTYFAAHGTVRVIRPVVSAPNGGELLLTGVPYLVRWQNPTGWRPDYAALYYSLDRGATWTLIDAHVVGDSYPWNVPNVTSPSAKIRVYLFDSAGVMGYDSSDQTFGMVTTLTGVEVAESSLPTKHALYQNEPNPFNPTTEVRFDLPSASGVRLDVFAVDGRKVRTLLRAPMPAGRHHVLWDGRDDRGREVGSGVYLYKVKAGKYEAARRMILVK